MGIENRINSPPGYPVKDPTVSFWLANTRNDEIQDWSSSVDLPDKADIVIIGSGISRPHF